MSSRLESQNFADTLTSQTPGRGARRAADVLDRLRASPPALWYGGERIDDVTTHPATRNGVRSLAALYDLQWTHADAALYPSPASGLPVGRAFLEPRTL